MHKVYMPISTDQKMREQVQKALESAYRTLYESKKASSDQHKVGCHCEVCDWVDNYEYEQSKLEVEPWEPCRE